MTSLEQSPPSGGSLVDGSYAWLRLAVSVTLGTIGSVGF